MFKKKLVLGLAVLFGTLSVVGTIMPSYNLAWGDTKLCNFPKPQACIGSNSGDFMGGDGQNNNILGCGGGDDINGGNGNDDIIGDNVGTCGGTPGADRINGGNGDDHILHGNRVIGHNTDSDGNRDLINCGPGNDEADINVSVDNDVAINCETIFAG